jgi:hypothetical protein
MTCPLVAGVGDLGAWSYGTGTVTYETNETNVTHGTGTWVWDYGTLAWVLWFFVARNDDAKVCGCAFFCLKNLSETNPKNHRFRTQNPCDMPFGGGVGDLGAWSYGTGTMGRM